MRNFVLDNYQIQESIFIYTIRCLAGTYYGVNNGGILDKVSKLWTRDKPWCEKIDFFMSLWLIFFRFFGMFQPHTALSLTFAFTSSITNSTSARSKLCEAMAFDLSYI